MDSLCVARSTFTGMSSTTISQNYPILWSHNALIHIVRYIDILTVEETTTMGDKHDIWLCPPVPVVSPGEISEHTTRQFISPPTLFYHFWILGIPKLNVIFLEIQI